MYINLSFSVHINKNSIIKLVIELNITFALGLGFIWTKIKELLIITWVINNNFILFTFET